MGIIGEDPNNIIKTALTTHVTTDTILEFVYFNSTSSFLKNVSEGISSMFDTSPFCLGISLKIVGNTYDLYYSDPNTQLGGKGFIQGQYN